MEAAIIDKYYQNGNRYKLERINKCRLYLECFYISDIKNSKRDTIDPAYMNGTRKRRNPKMKFPTTRVPSKLEWSEWKSFLFRNFLTGNNKFSVRPMTHERKEEYTIHNTELQELRNIKPGPTLGDTIIEKFPNTLRQLLGKIVLPKDDGADIARALIDGTAIGGSDG